MKIIRERRRVTEYYYLRQFLDESNTGYVFPCDETGEVNPELLSEAARNNYYDCIQNKYPQLRDLGAVRHKTSYLVPAVGICSRCGREVNLVDEYLGACSCECGQWYNLFGQELLSPINWEEP